jgi:hypothetical protein
MLQNYQRRRNIKSLVADNDGRRKLAMAARAANLSTVRCRTSANILDFRLPQKHLLGDVMMETGYRAGAGEGQPY